jgi:hypothetical protein
MSNTPNITRLPNTPDYIHKTPTERARKAAMVRRDEQKSGKRNRIDPATCEIDYSSDEVEFMMALQRYKEQRRRPFPTTKEVLEVVRSLGYHKSSECQAVRQSA